MTFRFSCQRFKPIGLLEIGLRGLNNQDHNIEAGTVANVIPRRSLS